MMAPLYSLCWFLCTGVFNSAPFRLVICHTETNVLSRNACFGSNVVIVVVICTPANAVVLRRQTLLDIVIELLTTAFVHFASTSGWRDLIVIVKIVMTRTRRFVAAHGWKNRINSCTDEGGGENTNRDPYQGKFWKVAENPLTWTRTLA